MNKNLARQLQKLFFRAAFAIAVFLSSIPPHAKGFSLLGPYADWMQETNGYRQGGDIGGAVNIGEGYRWNVPIVTYGFDQSFLDYFGTNGVMAVENAIQILNDLPSASEINLNDYPANTRGANLLATAENLYDLKSVTLALLLEQLGLTQPARNVLALHDWYPSLQFDPYVCTNDVCPAVGGFPADILRRNFQPGTLLPSFRVNDVYYSGTISTNSYAGGHDIVEFPVDPLAEPYTAVADAFSFWYSGLNYGQYYTGLTRDDVGGISYLLSSNNVSFEPVIKGVHFTHKKRITGARRSGVEKITFLRHPLNRRGKFVPYTYSYTDTFTIDGETVQRPAKRRVVSPDFLFSMANIEGNSTFLFGRTGTTNWVNNAAQNGNPTNAGPGIIQPPIKITFQPIGAVVLSGPSLAPSPAWVMDRGWGSFIDSTNPPVQLLTTGSTNLSVLLRYYNTVAQGALVTNNIFHLTIPQDGQASLQVSTNQVEWTTLITVTNRGALIEWNYYGNGDATSFQVIPN